MSDRKPRSAADHCVCREVQKANPDPAKHTVYMQDCVVLLCWLAMDTESQCVSHTMCWEEQPMALKPRVTILMQDLLSLLGCPVIPGRITSSYQAAVTIYKMLCIVSCINVTSQFHRPSMLPINLWVTHLKWYFLHTLYTHRAMFGSLKVASPKFVLYCRQRQLL